MSATALHERLSPPARAFAQSRLGLLIGGDRPEAADGRTFTTYDPGTGRAIADVPLAGGADVERAVRTARAALEDGPWATLLPAERGRLIGRLADLVEANAAELAELEALDNGKPVKYARMMDVTSAVQTLRYAAGWPTKITGETAPVSVPGAFCYTRRIPIGVCAQIVPWNFPLLMAAWKIGPALAAGCTTILKPAEQTPLSALRLGELALEAGIPEGVLNVLTGDGSTGALLVEHPEIDKVAFTGSTPVGREIARTAGGRLVPVTLELGGKSASIILPDADVRAAAAGTYSGIYFNSGQMCNANSRVLVHEAVFDAVVEALVRRMAKARLGHGLAEGTDTGPVVSADQHDRVREYIASGVDEGAELVAGGRSEGLADGGWFVEPTLFASDGSKDLRILREEIFGPVLVVEPFSDTEAIARRANDTEFGLAAGIWTKDLVGAHRLAHRLRAGSVYVNGWGRNDPAAPFGGMKASGLGREQGAEGLNAYLETQSVWLDLGAP
ncbi:MAG: aldehyde dehydrogenase [Solirubrobacterales bacterium]|nr:aldehyde dehydrogenase [Solirubrobacterales bacterium]